MNNYWKVTLCTLFIFHQVNAQQLGGSAQGASAASGNVQQMQSLIDMPVSHFTGKPNISFPIYSAKSKTIAVNIGLSYDAGGIKTEQASGVAGLGWQLNGAGMISRSVRGNPDEGVFRQAGKMTSSIHTYVPVWASLRDSFATAIGKYGGFYADGGNNWDPFSLKSIIEENNLEAMVNQAPNIFTSGIGPELASFYLGLDDGEPDIFYFNIPGYSGKFFFDRNRNPVVTSGQSDLIIIPVFKLSTDTIPIVYPPQIGFLGYTLTYYFTNNYFESWKVITPEGLEYYFGETVASRTNNSGQILGATSISPESYYRQNNGWMLTRIVDPTAEDTVLFDYTVKVNNVVRIKPDQKYIIPLDSLGPCGAVSGSSTEPISEGVLTKITTKREVVDFFFGTYNKIDSIKYSDLFTSRFYQSFHFDYGKFGSGRVKLSGFTIRNLTSDKYFPYSFLYDEPAEYNGIFAQDFWGYYNGSNNWLLNTLAPGNTRCINPSNRMPSWPAMRAETLTEIRLPTGGRTIFEYEPHRAHTGYSAGIDHQGFSLDTNYIGGLRIKKISQINPGSTDTLSQNYRYHTFADTSVSSGHLYVPPSLQWYVDQVFCVPLPSYYVSTHNLISGHGSHVGYKHVTVFQEKNGVKNGHTEYEFYNDTNTGEDFYLKVCDSVTNDCDTTLSVLLPWMQPYSPENLLNGFEKEKRIYNKDNVLLVKQESDYQTKLYAGFTRTAQLSTIDRTALCGGIPQWVIYTNPIPGGGSQAVSSGTLFYMNSNVVGKKIVLPRKNMVTTYHSSSPVKTDTTFFFYDNPLHNKPTRVVNRNSRGDSILQHLVYSFDLEDVTSGDSTVYFMKKAFRNVPMASFSYKKGKVVAGSFQRFGLKSRLDSTVIRLKEEYALQTNSAGYTPVSLNITAGYPKSFAFTAAYFDKQSSYGYNTQSNAVLVEDRSGLKAAFLWDWNATTKVAEAANADTLDIAYTSFETVNNGRWQVSGSARNTTAYFTGKKSYTLSNGSVTRSGLNPDKAYMVSYWSSSAAASVNGVAGSAGKTKNSWTYFEHRLPLSTTSVTVSGSSNIDELRLYPSDSRISTYVHDPALGVTAMNDPSGTVVFNEYDNNGMLSRVLDEDGGIITNSSYFHKVSTVDTAIWRILALPWRQKPCSLNSSYSVLMKQFEFIDVNPGSSTYLTRTWRDDPLGIAANASIGIAAWEATATPLRCKKNEANENTGEQEREEKDMNPCSTTYNQTRWVLAGVNTSSCPLPCVGEGYMIIGGVCTLGTKVYTSCTYTCIECSTYTCTYYYYWPGCITSQEYEEITNEPREIGTPCIPD